MAPMRKENPTETRYLSSPFRSRPANSHRRRSPSFSSACSPACPIMPSQISTMPVTPTVLKLWRAA